MNPTQTHSRQFLEQAIDAEIKTFEESIRALKLRRNALQPISYFPPEIFAAIFSFLSLPGIPSLGGTPALNLTRFRISHVCHQWREIALNQPQLWSYVDFNAVSLAGAAEILVRAKSVPLYMEIRTSSRDYRFGLFLKEAQAHLPQIRHLSIGAESFGLIHGQLENALVSPAPTLEYLSLFFHDDENRRLAGRLVIPDLPVIHALFGGSTPRLSCLKLRNCNIGWDSPLFKGLRYLEILKPHEMARPTLAVWLDTLGEIPQLRTLTLRSASPVAAHFPFDVKRTVTLPSLTHLDISASLPDCALASAHLDLPALTSLRLTAIDPPTNASSVQQCLPYVVRHVNGPQDDQPLQSVLIRNRDYYLELLAWPVPDIDTLVHDPPSFLGVTLPTRVKLSFRSEDDDHHKIFEIMMTTLPLDGLLTLVAVDLQEQSKYSQDLTMQQFWLPLSPNLPVLRRVRLGDMSSPGFIQALLEDDGGCENPLFPSLTALALHASFFDDWPLRLCDTLMKRVEQRVPLETLDLLMWYMYPYNPVTVRLFNEIVADVLYPLYFLGREDLEDADDEERCGTGRKMLDKMVSLWSPLSLLPFSDDDNEETEDDDF